MRSDCPERKGATLGESGVTKQVRAADSYKWLVFSASFANSAVKIFKAFNRKVRRGIAEIAKKSKNEDRRAES